MNDVELIEDDDRNDLPSPYVLLGPGLDVDILYVIASLFWFESFLHPGFEIIVSHCLN